jgi:hypothetical protein
MLPDGAPGGMLKHLGGTRVEIPNPYKAGRGIVRERQFLY